MNTPPTPVPRKKRAKFVALGLLAAAMIAGAVAWVMSLGKESTDDAQVEGHVLSVASRIPGQVIKVLVADNQLVEADQVIVELDRRELEARMEVAGADAMSAKAALELAQAQLDLTQKNSAASLRQAKGGISQAASTVTVSKATLEQAKADLAAAESRAKLAKLDLDRSKELIATNAVPQAETDAKQAASDQAAALLEQARARLDGTRAAITGGYGGVEQAEGRLVAAQTGPQQVQAAKAQVDLAAARLDQAEGAKKLADLNLTFASIRAPSRGVITRRTVEVGNMVSPDRPLLAIVPLHDVWVVANFKEDQIGGMRPGQPATIRIDAYGRRAFAGHVDSLSAGTGARFALLPPDNASGNFVKVVQRVPVLIRIDDRAGLEFRPGMSADVTVRLK
jgi:membrane fusion protein (multidrug efflux system)